MGAHVKAAIGLAVFVAALGAFFGVHAVTGGADSTKQTAEATRTPPRDDAHAPVVSAVCAERQQDCAEATVVPDSELTCEEAAACAPGSDIPAIKCDRK